MEITIEDMKPILALMVDKSMLSIRRRLNILNEFDCSPSDVKRGQKIYEQLRGEN